MEPRRRAEPRARARVACALAAAAALGACAFVPLPRLGPGGGDASVGTPSRYVRDREYGAPVRRSFYVPMRDGVRLAVDLLLPRDLPPGARVPALLHQGRYWRSVSLRGPARVMFDRVERHGQLGPFKAFFVQHGYAWLDVDTRGSGASFGTRLWDFSPDEIRDGSDLVEWIVRQRWSDGRVAGVGVSYSGSAAELLLANRHPAVKAALPLFCDFDQYQDILAPGGVPHRAWLEAWGEFTRRLDRGLPPLDVWWMRLFVRGVRPVDGDERRALLAAALAEHAGNFDFGALAAVVHRDDLPFAHEASAPDPARARADAWLAAHFGPDFRGRGTDLASPHAYAADVDAAGAPLYAYSGWLDGAYAGAAAARFAKLHHPHNRLLLGPWDHALHAVSPWGARGPSRFDHRGELLRFLDAHVRGLATGLEREPRVHYYTTGAERWRASDTWPPPAAPRVLYLAPHGALAPEVPAAAASADRYDVDFAAASGPASRWSALSGRPLGTPYPDRAARDRALLVYDSTPLAAPLEVTGQAVATLYVASSATDGAFFAYLEDVAPDGRVAYVTEGLLRALHRGPPGRPDADPLAPPPRSFRRSDAAPLVPGEVAELAIPLLPSSTVFAAGHRVRLALAGADADHFARIPARGAVEWSVHRSAAHPSRLTLPVPAERRAERAR
ncbi:MAG TPA: CocE/NonD family hydrolase [Myxococcota bacterium]|nr:CocE/NonD family hydrolase [Myxococcota bacterium]